LSKIKVVGFLGLFGLGDLGFFGVGESYFSLIS